MKYTAIVLAAGKGSRMGSGISKQFMELEGHPLLYYPLQVFEQSCVDDIILVTGQDDIGYCKREIVDRYGLKKISDIVAGGQERYLSVYHGLCAAADPDIVLIHDGARPFVTDAIIRRTIRSAMEYGSGVAAMPIKDTVKIVDDRQFAVRTPDRRNIWIMQTPQTFRYTQIRSAYETAVSRGLQNVTDDAMVMELTQQERVKLVEGSYRNIKVTTPEDLVIAAAFIREAAGVANGLSDDVYI